MCVFAYLHARSKQTCIRAYMCKQIASDKHLYAYMCVCMHTCACVCMNSYMCMCMHTCACVCMHVHVYAYMCMCMHTCACVCIHVHVVSERQTHRYARICIES